LTPAGTLRDPILATFLTAHHVIVKFKSRSRSIAHLLVFYKFFQLIERLLCNGKKNFDLMWNKHDPHLGLNLLVTLLRKYKREPEVHAPADLLIQIRNQILAHDKGSVDHYGCLVPLVHDDAQRLIDFLETMGKLFPHDPFLLEMFSWE